MLLCVWFCNFLSRSLSIDLVNIRDSVKSKPLMRTLVSNVRLYLLYTVMSFSCGRVSRMSTFRFRLRKQAVYVNRHIQVVNFFRSIMIARYCSTSTPPWALNVALNAIIDEYTWLCMLSIFLNPDPGPGIPAATQMKESREVESNLYDIWSLVIYVGAYTYVYSRVTSLDQSA